MFVSSDRTTPPIVSRLLTAHPRLLVALLALVGFIALQGSAAAADTTVSVVDGLDGVFESIEDGLDGIEFGTDEEITTDPGP